MLDNFGLGEFFFLAMLALLFFGPERLPQIGARLGRWVGSLTQYSKAFLTEWREEALAVHEAVEEVRGIRDEIVAARAELSSTLNTAREDLTEGVDAAREAVTGARLDVAQQIKEQQEQTSVELDRMAKEENGELEPDGSGEQEAIERTQQILDGLLKSRETTPAEAVDDGAGTEAPVEQEPLPEEAEWERNRRLIMESMGQGKEPLPRSAYYAPDEKEKAGSPAVQKSEPKAVTSSAPSLDTAGPGKDEAEKAPEQPQETPFERTQRVLEELRRKRAGEAVEEPAVASEETELPAQEAESPAQEAVEEAPERPKMATAFDRTQAILEGLRKKRSGAQQETEPAAITRPVSVEPAEFEQLSAQVTQMREEIAALRQELQALRAAAAGVDETMTDELPVEEAA
jgi:electron transport complex protein RnfC